MHPRAFCSAAAHDHPSLWTQTERRFFQLSELTSSPTQNAISLGPVAVRSTEENDATEENDVIESDVPDWADSVTLNASL